MFFNHQLSKLGTPQASMTNIEMTDLGEEDHDLTEDVVTFPKEEEHPITMTKESTILEQLGSFAAKMSTDSGINIGATVYVPYKQFFVKAIIWDILPDGLMTAIVLDTSTADELGIIGKMLTVAESSVQMELQTFQSDKKNEAPLIFHCFSNECFQNDEKETHI